MTQRHEELMDAAVQLFQQNGFHATSVADITEACGISKGAFYKHFNSKENMILKLLQQYYDDMFSEADRPQDVYNQSPLLVLKRKIMVELEKSLEYRSFFLALLTEFPPYETGPIPEFLSRIQATHQKWHKRALLNAFGSKTEKYLDDLTLILEGILHSYLMQMIWKGTALPLDKLSDLITECLKAIVENDELLTPILSVYNSADSETFILESISNELHALRSEMNTDNAQSEKDLQTIDFLAEELTQEKPREFLVDALLAQLHQRSYLKTRLIGILTEWEIWKGE
ncbi:putative HTH-type transcriptional regulator YerO [Lentibacillus kapialis]|uniref:HTH-type transcriptional regulator YerO n=1 Tax=Lentibacillus kapialis TaxID=340214 RepID=A0A917UYN8_9BACI|nr:TetR/AcrR family transcriptional regulator [Lentibacillus kapialis]GGJ96454.1 putative HTH-type transcriptional regulator YerO [Lentibacillus kapialis]